MVKLKHLQHILSVRQFVLELLKLSEFRLEDGSLDVNLVFEAIEAVFFFVKNCLFLEHFVPFRVKPRGGLLNAGCQLLELSALRGEGLYLLGQLLVVQLNQLVPLLKHALLAAQFVVFVGHLLLAGFDVDFLGLDFADEGLANVCLQLHPLLVLDRKRVFDLCLLVSHFDFNEAVASGPPLVLLVQLLAQLADLLLGFSLFVLETSLLLSASLYDLVSVFAKPGDFLVVLLLQTQERILLLLQTALFVLKPLLLNLNKDLLVLH